MDTIDNFDFLEKSKDLKVLYVEDSDMVRESTYDMMKEFFLHIDVAEDGVKGLEKFNSFHKEHNRYYDIVFTDINMPNMNGIDMSRAILQENKASNIVVISAHNESEYLLKLINMGISYFILKPISIMQYEEVVFKLITTILNEKELKKNKKELLEMNAILKVARTEAVEASSLKSQFLANMSHEIRTPLNAINGFIYLLNEKEKDEEKLKYLNVIQNSSNSLLQIINDILDISKIESGKMELNFADFCPYKELISIGELFQVKAAQEGVNFNIKHHENIPKYLHSDVLRIKQVYSNLLSNAIKFTPKGGAIEVDLWYDNAVLNIRVKDDGIGIAKNKQKHIFDSFTQAETSTVRKYGGTGLGLSISARLTELLGGELVLDSEEGKGSTFQLSVAMPHGKEEIKEEVLTQEKVNLNAHILVVEDNEANQMFVGIVLNNAGITHDSAYDGEEAIEKFKSGEYDLILMDENMPKLSGSSATKAIIALEKEQGLKHTPIISLTANAIKGDRERFLKVGMDDYLSKPIEPLKLMDMIYKYLK